MLKLISFCIFIIHFLRIEYWLLIHYNTLLLNLKQRIICNNDEKLHFGGDQILLSVLLTLNIKWIYIYI